MCPQIPNRFSLPLLILVYGLGTSAPSILAAADVPAGFPNPLPPGVSITSTTSIPVGQLGPIGNKLGGQITDLTNSQVHVQGRSIQVNIITASDDRNSEAIYNSLLKIKPAEYCWRKGRFVIEFVGRSVDVPLAMKTANELAFRQKPIAVRYQVEAALATVDQADYMACNPLFNQLLQYESNRDAATQQQVAALAAKFRFGNSLSLRDPQFLGSAGEYRFNPAAIQTEPNGSSVVYTFREPSTHLKIPFVNVVIQTTVEPSRTGLRTETPAAQQTAATEFWPVDDREIRSLAEKVTAGAKSNRAKADAILKWLAPGKNLRYDGKTGSRWGTTKVLQQRFGHCWDFSDCFVTLARSVGVPTRQVAGWLYGSSGHVWAEYYDEQAGWRQVDPTGAGVLPCGIYHIAYFTSDDGEMPVVYLSMPKIQILEERWE